MKIAVLYHSETGHTERFANALAEALMQGGHTVNSMKLQTASPVKQGSVRDKQEIKITNLPNANDFDVILFGGPVWAFGPSPVIIAAIRQLGSLKGKKAVPFATMGFPFKWMGGSAALRYMQRELATKGATLLPGKICSHMLKNLDSEIEQATRKIIQTIN
jgi:flavodoxin